MTNLDESRVYHFWQTKGNQDGSRWLQVKVGSGAGNWEYN
jgi:hypothetical protein